MKSCKINIDNHFLHNLNEIVPIHAHMDKTFFNVQVIICVIAMY